MPWSLTVRVPASLSDRDFDVEVAECALEVAERREGLDFLRGVDSVRDKLTQKYFVVAV